MSFYYVYLFGKYSKSFVYNLLILHHFLLKHAYLSDLTNFMRLVEAFL